MRNRCIWILLLIIPCVLVTSYPLEDFETENQDYNAKNIPKSENESQDRQVISVRITSSVAIDRGKGNSHRVRDDDSTTTKTLRITEAMVAGGWSTTTVKVDGDDERITTAVPPSLAGANIEFIKQLNAKKEARGLYNFEQIHPFQLAIQNQQSNETDDSVAEPSIKSVLKIPGKDEENVPSAVDVPPGRSLAIAPSSPKNYIQGLMQKSLGERGNDPTLTTVSFNVVHDAPTATANYDDPSTTYSDAAQSFGRLGQFYNEPAKVYSQPAQVYSEPAKIYSEPAKIYSEPAKIYSEPARVYSEPAKIYSQPAKFYSEPASLHLNGDVSSNRWRQHPQVPGTAIDTTPVTTVATNPTAASGTRQNTEHQPEMNYEVDEKVSVMTDGKSHGVQEPINENCKQDKCKVGYVVEGRQYRKYRVEERTPDGFIVGEYGVVRNEDGALRGVRYTADGEASPRLIYDALMKFLQLK